MSFKVDTCHETTTLNKYGWHLAWPRIWIHILGIILLSLCIYIAAMEVGHTLFDSHRSTAFAGVIVFIPLLICAIFVLITACRPKVIFLRITTILCCIMIVLCLALIAYDILVLIDPTRCFLLSCTNAVVTYEVNSTYKTTITGWPLNITWPEYFQSHMTGKRVLQSTQLLCACLFILFCSFYILTYIIYRNINLHRSSTDKIPEKTTTSTIIVRSHPKYNYKYRIPTYHMDAYRSSSLKDTDIEISQQIEAITSVQPQTSSINCHQICRRCMEQPRMISTTSYERENFYSYVCTNCSIELLNDHQQLPIIYSINESMRTVGIRY